MDRSARAELLPSLAALLEDAPFHVMCQTLEAVRIAGPPGEAARHVHAALKRSVAQGRPHAAELSWNTLMEIDAAAKEAAAKEVAALVPAGGPRVMVAGCAVLGGSRADRRTVVPALVAVLESDDLEAAVAAAKALVRFGRAPAAVPVLIKRLEEDKYPLLVRPCIQALAANRAEAVSAIPVLRTVLNERRYGRFGDGYIAREIMRALRAMGEPGEEAIAMALAEGSRGAAWAFEQVKEKGTTRLRDILRDEDARAVTRAAKVLGRLEADARDAVPALIQVLDRKGAEAEAAAALIRIGHGGETLAVTRLIGMAERENDDNDLASLAKFLSGLTRSVRHREDLAHGVARALLEILKKKGERSAPEAIEALAELGPLAAEAVPELQQYVGTSSPLAVGAVEALDEITGRR